MEGVGVAEANVMKINREKINQMFSKIPMLETAFSNLEADLQQKTRVVDIEAFKAVCEAALTDIDEMETLVDRVVSEVEALKTKFEAAMADIDEMVALVDVIVSDKEKCEADGTKMDALVDWMGGAYAENKACFAEVNAFSAEMKPVLANVKAVFAAMSSKMNEA